MVKMYNKPMEPSEFVRILTRVSDVVKRLSQQGTLEKLKEAKDHIDLAADLVVAIVMDVLGEEKGSRTLESPEMTEILQEARTLLEQH
jgi:hypothetical protein